MQLPLGRLTAALVAIIAVAAVAASLPIVVETPGDSETGADGGVPEVNGPEGEPDERNAAIIMRAIEVVAILLVVIALFAFVLHDRRELLRRVLAGSALIAIVVLIWYLVLQSMDAFPTDPREPPSGLSPNGTLDGSSGSGDGSGSSRSPALSAAEAAGLATVVLGLVLGGLAIRYRLLGTDEPGEDRGATVDVGSVAGDTADRIESESVPSVENAVYDAWYRMTTYLPVENPNTSTPGEFTAAAIDAGLDRDDVEELTSLFESVRYGPETASGVTERRAVEILRRIESAYAESETIPAAGGAETGERPGSGDAPRAPTETAVDGSAERPRPEPADTEPRREGERR